jgi:hypothetical protein
MPFALIGFPFQSLSAATTCTVISTAYPFILLVAGTQVIPKTPRKIPFSETLHYLRRQLQGIEDHRQGDLRSFENKSTSLKVRLSEG